MDGCWTGLASSGLCRSTRPPAGEAAGHDSGHHRVQMTGLWVTGALALALAAALWWVRRRYDGFRFWAVARLRDVYPDLAGEHETPAEITGRLAGGSGPLA